MAFACTVEFDENQALRKNFDGLFLYESIMSQTTLHLFIETKGSILREMHINNSEVFYS